MCRVLYRHWLANKRFALVSEYAGGRIVAEKVGDEEPDAVQLSELTRRIMTVDLMAKDLLAECAILSHRARGLRAEIDLLQDDLNRLKSET